MSDEKKPEPTAHDGPCEYVLTKTLGDRVWARCERRLVAPGGGDSDRHCHATRSSRTKGKGADATVAAMNAKP